MGNKLYDENAIRNIARAIRFQGISGSFKISQMASAIEDISISGAGGGGVFFIDYDGTRLDYWAPEDVASKTALPTNPTIHPRLTGIGWNWSLNSIKDYIASYPMADVVVGQMYNTVSGKTEVDIIITKATGLTFNWTMTGTKDWGDGTTDSDTSHTYANYGEYTITCDGTEIPASMFKQYNNVKQVFVGQNVTTIGAWAFQECWLECVSIPNRAYRVREKLFNRSRIKALILPQAIYYIDEAYASQCNSLEWLSISDSVDTIYDYAFQMNPVLKKFTLPKRRELTLGYNAFHQCPGLKKIIVPSGCKSNNYVGSFSQCEAEYVYYDRSYTVYKFKAHYGYTGESITIPEGVTELGYEEMYETTAKYVIFPSSMRTIGGAFSGSGGLKTILVFDFTAAPSVVSLTSSGSIVPGDPRCKIIVPDSLYDSWITATNWVTVANYIYKASEV